MFVNQYFVETRKNSLVVMAEERAKYRMLKGKKVWEDGVNQRATKKLEIVCETFKDVLGEKVKCSGGILLQRDLYFEQLEPIKHLQMYYYPKNTLFTRVFDLIVKAEWEASESIGQDIDVAVDFKGALKIRDAELISLDNSPLSRKLVERLNRNPLIKERILALELLDFRIKYDCNKNRWMLALGMGRGSVVWSLIPPMLMLVDFSKTAAIKTIELYQLVLCEIAASEKHPANALRKTGSD